MTLEEASNIVNLWGIHLEHVTGKLSVLFSAKIPESFLPFPIKKIELALNILAEYHHNQGNIKTEKDLLNSIGSLLFYIDDEKAILEAAKFFDDSSWRKSFLPIFKNLQTK